MGVILAVPTMRAETGTRGAMGAGRQLASSRQAAWASTSTSRPSRPFPTRHRPPISTTLPQPFTPPPPLVRKKLHPRHQSCPSSRSRRRASWRSGPRWPRSASGRSVSSSIPRRVTPPTWWSCATSTSLERRELVSRACSERRASLLLILCTCSYRLYRRPRHGLGPRTGRFSSLPSFAHALGRQLPLRLRLPRQPVARQRGSHRPPSSLHASHRA